MTLVVEAEGILAGLSRFKMLSSHERDTQVFAEQKSHENIVDFFIIISNIVA